MNKELFDFLSQFVMPERLDLFNRMAALRTRYLTVAIEDVFQPQNASAVLRTSDCFGIQDVHIIENKNEYRINPDVALGSFQWLDMYRYNSKAFNTPDAIQNLRSKGYRIVATTPHINDVSLDDFDLSKGKVAFVFGTELEGLTAEVLDNADEYLKIPIYGFTESFNISVSAAIILHHLSRKLRLSDINWNLSEDEQIEIKIKWLKQSIKKSDLLIERFMAEKAKSVRL
ncbi:MAG: RNA methyltransferase [Bacteroidetes bacterium GWF2_38_335]|nr:MAG: RNA methyltransferase [Bacteroidetes bacterium GWF2_38_335]OFY78491.1 MAG: RNA methyltransferase [Bacteroidetes bacterium RIFOXYA12_FULL_38_20]HBS88439.1 TrmH family RNA methyltransferase [Bacteroidales bacterium]